jgi:P pilus assembly chaperone PapD
MRYCLVTLAGWMLAAQVFAAANISVWPVHVYISPEQPIGVINLKNQSAESVNLQAEAFTWEMDEHGKTTLTDVGDFVFFPKMLSLKPNEEKALNVGYDGDFPGVEKPYRLKVRELPKLKTPEKLVANRTGMGLEPVLEFSVPLFVTPTRNRPPPQAVLEAPSQTAKGVQVGVRNPGQHNFLMRSLNLYWLNARGKTVLEQQHEYAIRVLPQRRLFVEVPVADLRCRGAAVLRAELHIEQVKQPHRQEFPLGGGRCVP